MIEKNIKTYEEMVDNHAKKYNGIKYGVSITIGVLLFMMLNCFEVLMNIDWKIIGFTNVSVLVILVLTIMIRIIHNLHNEINDNHEDYISLVRSKDDRYKDLLEV